MPRQPRIEIPGHLYHVIARGIERGRIFINHDDYTDFLSSLEKTLDRTEDIMSTSRVREVVRARAFYSYLAKE